jgi:transcriptional regulator with XRE-family HTH domain
LNKLDKEKFNKKLGDRIRLLREKKGLSSRDFETYDSSIDRHALSKIENGKTIPSAFTLYKISQVLEMSLSELLKGIDE